MHLLWLKHIRTMCKLKKVHFCLLYVMIAVYTAL